MGEGVRLDKRSVRTLARVARKVLRAPGDGTGETARKHDRFGETLWARVTSVGGAPEDEEEGEDQTGRYGWEEVFYNVDDWEAVEDGRTGEPDENPAIATSDYKWEVGDIVLLRRMPIKQEEPEEEEEEGGPPPDVWKSGWGIFMPFTPVARRFKVTTAGTGTCTAKPWDGETLGDTEVTIVNTQGHGVDDILYAIRPDNGTESHPAEWVEVLKLTPSTTKYRVVQVTDTQGRLGLDWVRAHS